MSATFQTSTGGPSIQGRAAERPGSMREQLPTNASPPFWYMHHPARWQLVEGEWLPQLSEMRSDPGVNRVDKDGNTDQAELAYRRKGWTIIPWDLEPGGYCIAFEGHRGPVHMSKWEKPSVFAGQLTIKSDSAGYWAFCRRLLADGVIARPDERFIDIIISDQARKVDDLRGRAVTQPAIVTTLNIEEERLAVMLAAKERLVNPSPAKAKK
jgi:hypothetical protein